jgi:hypothetical protein
VAGRGRRASKVERLAAYSLGLIWLAESTAG